MTAAASRHRATPSSKEQLPYVERRKKRHTGVKLLGILVVWLVALLRPQGPDGPRPSGLQDTTELHQKLNEARDWVQLEGQDNWFFGGVLGAHRRRPQLPRAVLPGADRHPGARRGRCPRSAGSAWSPSRPGSPSSSPGSGRRSWSRLAMLFFGVVGLWPDSMDTLIITVLSVVICIVIGMPVGIWMARSKAVSAAVTPVLDLMQTLPAFCYLAPLALFFGIGSAVRGGADDHLRAAADRPDHRARHPHGVDDHHRGGPLAGTDPGPDAASGAAADGQAHHRGRHQPVHDGGAVDGHDRRPWSTGPVSASRCVAALQILNVGAASVAGLAIVVMAIMLDRTTTAASERVAPAAPTSARRAAWA